MPIPPFMPMNPDGPVVSASDFNRLQKEAELASSFNSSGRLVSERDGGGYRITDTTPERIYLQITGAGTGSSYPWQEVFWNGTAWQTFADGRTGTATSLPANEITGSTSVAVSTSSVAYEARLAPDERSYLFAVGGMGASVIYGKLTGPQPTGFSVGSGSLSQGTYYVWTSYITTEPQQQEYSATGVATVVVNNSSGISVASPPAEPNNDATQYRVYASTNRDPSTFVAQSSAINIGTAFNLTSLATSSSVNTPPFSYAWKQQAITRAQDSYDGSHNFLGTFSDSGIVATTIRNPAYEVGLSSYAYKPGITAYVRLYPGFSDPSPTGVEYLFFGGETADELVTSALICSSGGTPLIVSKTYRFIAGRLLFTN